ncbi:hypothetical protein CA267_001930 [Alteromonas pelagimontana]|uniref:Uncharacterized protein n=1 Tax=Alteromonas pelagimontana TaxID=1858656 RepID=A0A6M4M907_9ALTE|nr:hypothetical protein [Alteromonas pelagimontana]QJR79643.1 hypothetical protein CA267_001930 [Alteromonas pelagimontana]
MFGLSEQSILDIKYFIEDYSLALMALAFISYTVSVGKVTAFNLTLFFAVVLHLLHQYIARTLLPLYDEVDFKQFLYYFWYLSFAVTDVVFVLASLACIRKFKLLRDRVSNFLLICYLGMAAIQVLRLIDRELDIDALGAVYSNSIILTNIVVTIAVILMAVRVLLVRSGRVLIPAKE